MEGSEQGLGHTGQLTLAKQVFLERMLRLKDCDQLVVRKLVTVENIATGLREKGRQGIVDRLWKFIEVCNHEAVNVGGLRQGIKSVLVVKTKFTADFQKQSSEKEQSN